MFIMFGVDLLYDINLKGSIVNHFIVNYNYYALATSLRC